MADKKYLSILTDRLLPEFLREEYSNFLSFIRIYLEYLEENGNIGQVLLDFLHYIDVDKINLADPYSNGDDDVLQLHIAQYLSSFPTYRVTDIDIKKLIKNAKDFYSAKGTERSYEFIFRLMGHFGKFSFYYPQEYIMTLNSSDQKLSSNSYLHDNYYRAYFTYEIQSSLYGYVELKDIIKNLLHPLGCKAFFLRYVVSNNADDPYEYMEGINTRVFAFGVATDEWASYGRIQDIITQDWTIQDLEDGIGMIGKTRISNWNWTFDEMENPTGKLDKFIYQYGTIRTVL